MIASFMRDCAEYVTNINTIQVEAILSLNMKCLTLTLSSTQSLTITFSTSLSLTECTSACKQYDNYIIYASLDFAYSCLAILNYGPLCSYCALNLVQQMAIGGLINDCTILSYEGFLLYMSSSSYTIPLTISLKLSTIASHAISTGPIATSSSAALTRSNELSKLWNGFIVVAGLLLALVL